MICNLCQKDVVQLKTHIKDCENSKLIAQITNNMIRLTDSKVICLRCGTLNTSKENHHIHNKSCKRASQKAISSSIQIGNYYLEQEQPPLDKTQKKQKKQPQRMQNQKWELKNQIMNLTTAKLAFQIQQWCEINKLIPKSALAKIFESYLDKCGNLLRKHIPIVEISTLYKVNRKIKWEKIIRHSAQIFYKDIIEQRIKSLDEKEKIKIYKALNSIYMMYGECFQRFKIPQITYNTKKEAMPIRYQDFLTLILKLFQKKQKGYVHLGIQFLIMLQCRQRIPSMIFKIQEKLNQILDKRKNSKRINSIQLFASKTKEINELIFTDQLLSLIQLTKWRKFSQNLRSYKRLSQKLPFSLYCLRKTFFSMLWLLLPNMMGIQKFTLHKSYQNVNFYTKQQQRASYVQIINKQLYIPFIKNLSGVQVQKETFVDRFQQKSLISVQFKLNWFQFFQNAVADLMDKEQLDILNDKCVVQNVQYGNISTTVDFVPLQEIQEIYNNQTLVLQQVLVNYNRIILKNGIIESDQLYVSSKYGNCVICSNDINGESFVCRFCQSYYHQQCKTFLCRCYSLVTPIKHQITAKSNKKFSQKIKMPQEYVGKFYQNQQQIRALINLRGLKYCSIYRLTELARKFIEENPMNQLDLEYHSFRIYDKYIEYEYFPPIRLGIFGQSSTAGTGFGIFATTKIERNVFLGEYASDAFLRLQTYTLRRHDCTIGLINNKQIYNNIDIGPISYGGYVLLINESKDPNCSFKKCIINNRIAIIVFSLKTIYPDEQLLIDYKRVITEMGNDIQEDQNKVIQVINQDTKKSIQNCVGLINLGNTCYINVSLQLLRIIYANILIDSDDIFLKEINKFFKQQTGIFEPKAIAEYLINSANEFQRLVQGDYGSALLTMYNKLIDQEDTLDQMSFTQKTYVTCQKCQSVTTKDQSCSIVYLYSNKIDLVRKDHLKDFHCLRCNEKGPAALMTNWFGFNKYCLFQFKRYSHQDKKLLYSGYTPQQIILQENSYKKIFLILHKGQQMKSGHYIAVDIRNKIMFDDQNIQTKFTINHGQIYAVLYEKK